MLTYELRELLAASAPARIVTLSSTGHRFASFRWDDLATMERWRGSIAAYGAAKLCNIWFARESARRLAAKNVTSNARASRHGRLGLRRDRPGLFRLGARVRRPFLKTTEQGARTSIHVASAPELEGASGLYFVD